MIIYTLILFIFIIFYQQYTQKIEHSYRQKMSDSIVNSIANINTNRLLKKADFDKAVKKADTADGAAADLQKVSDKLNVLIDQFEKDPSKKKMLDKLKTKHNSLKTDITDLANIKDRDVFSLKQVGAEKRLKKIHDNKLSTKFLKKKYRNAAILTTGGVASAAGIQMAVTGDSLKDSLTAVLVPLRENALEPLADVTADVAAVVVEVGAETATTILKAGVNASGGLIDALGSGVGSIFGAFGFSGMAGLGSFGLIIIGIVIYFVFTQSTGTSESSANILLY